MSVTDPRDPALHAAAAQHPGGWIYDVDVDYPADRRTPPEAIRGAWEAGSDGRPTGRFEPNPRYRPVERCDRALKPYVHAAARSHPGEWIAEIDPHGEHRFPDVPEDMIRGWWRVDADGRITDAFRPNSRWIDDPGAPARPPA